MLSKLVIISIKIGLVPAVRSWLNHHPAEIDSTDAKGNTLLHYAVLSGSYSLCAMLINEYGANPCIANIDGTTAIEMARKQPDLFYLFKRLEQDANDAEHENIQTGASWEEEFLDGISSEEAKDFSSWEENTANIISSENDEQLIKQEQSRQASIGRSRYRTDMEDWYIPSIEKYHFRERKFINEEDEHLFIFLVSVGQYQGWILRDFLEYFSFFPPKGWEGMSLFRTVMLEHVQKIMEGLQIEVIDNEWFHDGFILDFLPDNFHESEKKSEELDTVLDWLDAEIENVINIVYDKKEKRIKNRQNRSIRALTEC